jgi:hypothetical protein
MRGVPVLASDSGYHPRSGTLPLARSSNIKITYEFTEIVPGILSPQRMILHYSIEPCRIASGELQTELLPFRYRVEDVKEPIAYQSPI